MNPLEISGRSARDRAGRRVPAIAASAAVAALTLAGAGAAEGAAVALTGCPDEVDVGRGFSVGVVIDTGGDDLGGYQAIVTFDGNTLNAGSIVGGSTSPYTRIGVVNIWNDRDTASFASMELGGLPRGRVHVATMSFNAVRAGGTTIAINVGQVVNGANDEIGRGLQSRCNVTVRPASEPAPVAGGAGMPGGGAPASPYAPVDAPPQTVSTAEAYGTSPALTRQQQAAAGAAAGSTGAPGEAPAAAPEPKRELTPQDLALLYDPRTYTERPPVPVEENPLVVAARTRTEAPAPTPAPSTPSPSAATGAKVGAGTATASTPKPAATNVGSSDAPADNQKEKKDSDVLFDAGDCRCSTRPAVDDGRVHLNFVFGGLLVAALGARRTLRRALARS